MIHIPRWAKRSGISHSCMESYDVFIKHFIKIYMAASKNVAIKPYIFFTQID